LKLEWHLCLFAGASNASGQGKLDATILGESEMRLKRALPID
jgi:hypothetical protein